MAGNGIFLTDEQRHDPRHGARLRRQRARAPCRHVDLKGGYPDDILPRMGKLGLMGMLVPPEI